MTSIRPAQSVAAAACGERFLVDGELNRSAGASFRHHLHPHPHKESPERTEAVAEPPPDDVPVTFCESPGAPFVFASATSSAAAPVSMPVAPAVDDLFARFVTRAAIGGDAKRGSMRLELGRSTGRGQLTVHAEGDEVEIELAAPAGLDSSELEARVTQRLAAKGLRVTRFDVR